MNDREHLLHDTDPERTPAVDPAMPSFPLTDQSTTPMPTTKACAMVTITTNGTSRTIPADEPVFLIRGQDAVGPAAVRAWADLAERGGASPEIVATARDHAHKMDMWPKKKVPDLAPPSSENANKIILQNYSDQPQQAVAPPPGDPGKIYWGNLSARQLGMDLLDYWRGRALVAEGHETRLRADVAALKERTVKLDDLSTYFDGETTWIPKGETESAIRDAGVQVVKS